MSVPVLALAGIVVVAAALRRDRRILLFAAWALSAFAGLLMMGVVNDRFFCYWVPPFCALAAAAVHIGKTRLRSRHVDGGPDRRCGVPGSWRQRRTRSDRSRLAFARPARIGYEEAARYVADNPRGDTILYSAAVDTGYFVFFVRKADPERQAASC